MKKLLIASSVLAALTMNVAYAAPTTENGGTIEFIGEITDTTCYVDVQGSKDGVAGTKAADTSNTVLLRAAPVSEFAINGTAGRTPFFLQVHSQASNTTNPCVIGRVAVRDSNGIPTGVSTAVTKVKAIFGGNLQGETSVGAADGDIERYASRKGVTLGDQMAGEMLGNVDMVTGRLINIAAQNTTRDFAGDLNPLDASGNGAASGVKLRLLDSDLRAIKVGDTNDQIANNKARTLSGDTYGSDTDTTSLPYFVEYISDSGSTSGVTAGMVRSFVVYDLMYE